ncbi:hypothetical protein [Treponema endosymbiont of Eucomonympha sp.]|uniref:hypothetical protein n=1 Tax=Treponema endosymbiont of Eucomonympha sp. TaxID=1580831 RepID=UPI001650C93F|nr:hypothetical protein [Treponema endosymbiont of Eucomonympha sp.]
MTYRHSVPVSADRGCRNGEKGNGLCPFPFSSHRGSGKTASPMTAYRQGIGVRQ